MLQKNKQNMTEKMNDLLQENQQAKHSQTAYETSWNLNDPYPTVPIVPCQCLLHGLAESNDPCEEQGITHSSI